MPKFVVRALAMVLILVGAAPAIDVEATVKKVDADQRLQVFGAEQKERAVQEEPWEKLPNGVLGRLAGFDGVGGVKIAGYVRKPAGPGPFPIVIILHGGGPTAKATSGETEEERAKKAADEAGRAGKILGRASHPPLADFLAQGWAVYSIDYRTNPRYTLDPLEWEDTLVAVNKARSFSFVDPKRVAMIGGSHGGHVTARMASRVDLACAVICAPAGLDLIALFHLAQKGTPVGGNQKLIREMEQRSKVKMADIEKDPKNYDYSSPLTEIAKVRCPILMISGKNDANAPLPVMEAYVSQLRAAGKSADTYHPDNGPHGFYWGIPKPIPETAESTRRAVAFIKQQFEKATAPAPGFKVPDDVAFRTDDIMSEGTRMAAEVFAPKKPKSDKLPTIVMSHGWGGTAAALRPDAIAFAKAGFLVVTIDYRGWGNSDARLILAGARPEKKDGKLIAEVKEVRGVVDPIDQTTDILNAIHWVAGEKQCDADRIGIWGSSFSGGHVVYVAARDPRVKAFVSQVGSMDGRWAIANPKMRAYTFDQGAARTHGKLAYPKPGEKFGSMTGAPVIEKLAGYAPIEDIGRCKNCAMLFIIAEKEELFDNKDHAILAHERATGVKKLVTIKGIKHYGIYNEARDQAQKEAIGWFDEHLARRKPATPVKGKAERQDHSPRFRGTNADGIAEDDARLPDTWNKKTNVKWVADVPGWGLSCPVVWGNKVFVTTVVSDGDQAAPKKGLYLGLGVRTPAKGVHHWLVYCFDLKSGKMLWKHEAHTGEPKVPRHPKSSYAAETPTTDGKRLYVLFGDLGLYCYDLDGKPLWSHKIEPKKTFLDYGAAASPVVHEGQVLMLYDNQAGSYLASFDAASGKQRWRTERAEKTTWATPFIWKNKVRTEIVTCGKSKNRAYDLAGKLLWEFDGRMSNLVIPSPFAADNLLYITSGYVGDTQRPVYAIKPGASGDISLKEGATSNEFIAWYQPKAGPYNPSPIVYCKRYYTLFDFGFLTCHDALTGKEIYGKQRFPAGASFTASPWAYNGKLFFLSEDGTTYVVKAGADFQVLQTNALDELCLSTPAVSQGHLLIRTASKLYCIINDSGRKGSEK